MVSEAIDPANMTTDQFNEWYRTTYITELSKIWGWRRTSRFQAGVPPGGPEGPKPATPSWLAIHEFEDFAFEPNVTKVTALLGDSAETKAISKSAKRLDMAIWNLTRV